MNTPRFSAIGLVLVLLLTGCAVKFVYNQLDWVIPWYLDDYVSLDSHQEALLDSRLADYLAWHRREQLPVYADFIEWVAAASEDGFTRQELDEIFSRSQQLTSQIFQPIPVSFVEIFSQLSDAQIDEIKQNLAKKNGEYVKKYIETSEWRQRANRAEELQKFIERWTDELDEDQQEMIEQWSRRYLLMGREFLDSRRSWQRELYRILQRRDEQEFLQQALTALFTSRLQRNAQHQQKFAHNEQLLKDLYLQLDQSLSSYQRGRLARKLRAYARDFRELSQQQ